MTAFARAGDALTASEEQVLFAFADGLTSTEIALEQQMSVHTVKHHAKTLRKKLAAATMAHAVARAYHLGILVPKQAA